MNEGPQVPPDAILCARRGEPISEGDLQQVAEFAAFLQRQADASPPRKKGPRGPSAGPVIYDEAQRFVEGEQG